MEYNNIKFTIVENSTNGQTAEETVFKYRQEENIKGNKVLLMVECYGNFASIS
jgi:hypothetical protein